MKKSAYPFPAGVCVKRIGSSATVIRSEPTGESKLLGHVFPRESFLVLDATFERLTSDSGYQRAITSNGIVGYVYIDDVERFLCQ